MNSFLRVGLWVTRVTPGLVILITAFLAPSWRQPDGWLEPVGWVVAVVGLSFMIVGTTLRTLWQSSGQLLAVALIGHACALQLVFAPPYGVYQRFSPLSELLTLSNAPFVIGIIAQSSIVLLVARRTWPLITKCISTLISRQRLILFVGAVLLIQVLLVEDVFHYVMAVGLTAWISIVNVFNLVTLTMAVPKQSLEWISKWMSETFSVDNSVDESATPWDRALPWLIATWVIVVSATIALFVFERIPHIPDSLAYLFQAKYFSTGQLYLPAPPDAVSFEVTHIVNDGTKWFAYGFPGWPVILAFGVVAGYPWLVNPILGGLTVLVVHSVSRKMYGLGMAHAVVALLAVSPWYLFTTSSFMPHSAALFWALLAIWTVQRAREEKRAFWGVFAGCSLGMLFLTRPFEAIFVGGVIGLWALGLGAKRISHGAIVGMVVSGLLIASLVFPYNKILTGDATYAPHTKWTDEAWYRGADRLGFGPDIGNVNWPHLDPFPGHGLIDLTFNATRNLYASNFELFGWSFGSLCFVLLTVVLRLKWRREDWFFGLIILSVVGGYSLYWSSGGPDFGARYWYQALIPLLVFTVRGIQLMRERWTAAGEHDAARGVITFVAVASLVAFVNVMPWRSFGKYHNYRGMSAEINGLAKNHGVGHSLVFIKSDLKEDYFSAFVFNPRTLDEPGTVYAIDVGSAHRKVLRDHFADRPVWIIGKEAANEVGLRVLAGPLSPRS